MLTDDERIALTRAVLDVAEPARVIAHVGTTSTHRSIELAHRVAALGVGEVSAVTPEQCRTNPCSVVEHAADIRAATDGARLSIYVNPGLTGIEIPAAVMAQLDLSGVAGAKVSIPGVDAIRGYRSAVTSHFALLSGSDPDLAASWRAGATGVVSSHAAVAPRPFVALAHAVVNGDADAQRHAEAEVAAVIAHHRGAVPALKKTLVTQGFGSGCSRTATAPVDRSALGQPTS